VSGFKDRIEEYITSSAHLSKKHIHPRLAKMFEMGGMSAVFTRADGQYVWDQNGERYLDWLSGGGVYFMGRNNAHIAEALQDVLAMNLPNLSVVNASVLGGLLAEKLIELAGPQFTKVQYSNSGAEATEVAVRFARQITRKRRFLYLEGAFHGRSYAAISMCGFPQMREGLDPAMPTCTPIKPGDLAQLRRELKYGDVAAFIFEPLQGMTGKLIDVAYLREAEALCKQYGTVLIADEIQCGLGRTGSWFVSREMGIRPDMMTVSKTLSGGYVPVGAVLVSEDIYEKVFSGFSSGLVYFSTFAENNLAMAAGIATIEFLEQIDAPAQAKAKGQLIRDGLEALKAKYDVIDRLEGLGMMQTIYFKDSSNAILGAQQQVLKGVDSGAFAAAVHVDLFRRQKVVAQIPGPGVNAIKVLPPVITTEEDIAYFLQAFEDTLANFYGVSTGPIASMSRGAVENAVAQVQALIPGGSVPALLRGMTGTEEKKTPSELSPPTS
jgi:ornithine--oxo-acid transaminase